MRRYKIYFLDGKVLDVEVKSIRTESGMLILRGEKEADRAEFVWSQLRGYTSSNLIVSEEQS